MRLVILTAEPPKDVAVIIPVTFMLPVPVTFLLLRSKSPPSCGVVSSTTLLIPPPPPPLDVDPSAIRYCDDVPPLLTNEVAVTTPVTETPSGKDGADPPARLVILSTLSVDIFYSFLFCYL